VDDESANRIDCCSLPRFPYNDRGAGVRFPGVINEGGSGYPEYGSGDPFGTYTPSRGAWGPGSFHAVLFDSPDAVATHVFVQDGLDAAYDNSGFLQNGNIRFQPPR
jgi:hypothetical protein